MGVRHEQAVIKIFILKDSSVAHRVIRGYVDICFARGHHVAAHETPGMLSSHGKFVVFV
jgi:hypothetical protein